MRARNLIHVSDVMMHDLEMNAGVGNYKRSLPTTGILHTLQKRVVHQSNALSQMAECIFTE